LGHLKTTFAHLESDFKEGFILTLNRELHSESVAIQANGVDIAKGELMQVGDLLAVRITRMTRHGSR
jgi:flagellar motor switch/type III secretory pathway protein FliN